jgi:hypothetical protein
MPYFDDPHRVDSPNYRPPGRGSPEQLPVPMTVDGRGPGGYVNRPSTSQGNSATINQAHKAGYRPTPSDSRAVPIDNQPSGITDDDVPTHVYNLVVGANEQLALHLDNVGKQVQAGFLTETGIQTAVENFADSDAARAVDTADQLTDKWVGDLSARCDDIRAGLTQPGDAAQEMRNSRDWARTERRLDAAADVGHTAVVAKAAIDRAGPNEIGVLAVELPAWLESKGQPSDWVRTALAQRVPELGEAERDLAHAQKIASALKYDARTVKNAIKQGHPATHLVDPKVVK